MSESDIFLSHNIRPTAVRQLVWREIQHIDYAFSLADVEDLLPTVDRSSIFRTLTLFEEHDLLHGFEDGSGHRKFCLCLDHDEHGNHHHCHHVHNGSSTRCQASSWLLQWSTEIPVPHQEVCGLERMPLRISIPAAPASRS